MHVNTGLNSVFTFFSYNPHNVFGSENCDYSHFPNEKIEVSEANLSKAMKLLCGQVKIQPGFNFNTHGFIYYTICLQNNQPELLMSVETSLVYHSW